ncbi:nucleotide exchange factor GrpE [Frankia sp. AiPs1]|uniref:nucleotide exchange factor GrpE n=1 Tax=Frankia sp. AiPs1 TaxID=573493 RepID=UPI002043227F|nr:nucleotide exchange factor GrpE [Frankia sp. AiPs1]MCM3920228.1 nucleotide exchange factor GrpE [Frankia sp. AiPs1]
MGENRSDAERPETTPTPDLAAKLEQCQASHLRTLADFDNYRRRTGREIGAARAAERDRVVLAWVPVLDHLELALSHADADPDSLVDGVRGVHGLALDALRNSGITRLDDESGAFDPTRHEVGAVVDSGSTSRPPPAGTVVEVLRPGYLADGRVLRPASVAVSAGPKPNNGAESHHGPRRDTGSEPGKGPGPDTEPEAS